MGITGTSSAERDKLRLYLKKVGEYCQCPYVVGFGIKDRSDVVEINQMAHGAVVGSAIINEIKISDDPVESVQNYVKKLTLNVFVVQKKIFYQDINLLLKK